MVTIREINTHGGPEKVFEKYPVVGTKLTFEKLNECKKYSKKKLFVCADHT